VKCIQYFLSENVKGGDYSSNLGVDGRIILKSVLGRNTVGRCILDSSGPGWRPVTGFCEYVMNLRVP